MDSEWHTARNDPYPDNSILMDRIMYIVMVLEKKMATDFNAFNYARIRVPRIRSQAPGFDAPVLPQDVSKDAGPSPTSISLYFVFCCYPIYLRSRITPAYLQWKDDAENLQRGAKLWHL